MITIDYARDDMELLFIKMALEADGIKLFVAGEGFGSLYPGFQVSGFNQRPILVDERDAKRALEVIEQVRRDLKSVDLE